MSGVLASLKNNMQPPKYPAASPGQEPQFEGMQEANRVLHLAGLFVSSSRRHTRSYGDWSSDVCSSDLSGPAYSKLSVAVSFHFATASVQAEPGDQTSSLRIPSRVTLQTATSLVHRVSQMSAVTRCWRSGASCGSVGRSIRRLVVRCSSVKIVLSP